MRLFLIKEENKQDRVSRDTLLTTCAAITATASASLVLLFRSFFFLFYRSYSRGRHHQWEGRENSFPSSFHPHPHPAAAAVGGCVVAAVAGWWRQQQQQTPPLLYTFLYKHATIYIATLSRFFFFSFLSSSTSTTYVLRYRLHKLNKTFTSKSIIRIRIPIELSLLRKHLN